MKLNTVIKEKETINNFYKKIINSFSKQKAYGIDISYLFHSFKITTHPLNFKIKNQLFQEVHFSNYKDPRLSLGHSKFGPKNDISTNKIYYFNKENPEIFVQSNLGSVPYSLIIPNTALSFFTKVGSENKHHLLQDLYSSFTSEQDKRKFLDEVLRVHPYDEFLNIFYKHETKYTLTTDVLFEEDAFSIFLKNNKNQKLKISFFVNKFGYENILFKKEETKEECQIEIKEYQSQVDSSLLELFQEASISRLNNFLFLIEQNEFIQNKKIKEKLPINSDVSKINNTLLEISNNQLIKLNGNENIGELFYIIESNREKINTNSLLLLNVKKSFNLIKDETLKELIKTNINKIKKFISNQRYEYLGQLNIFALKNKDFFGSPENYPQKNDD